VAIHRVQNRFSARGNNRSGSPMRVQLTMLEGVGGYLISMEEQLCDGLSLFIFLGS
jgi:hypothetical protein